MSDAPRDLLLERMNRFGKAQADLMEGQASLGRNMHRLLERMHEQLERMEAGQAGLIDELRGVKKELHVVASEQILLANRVEDALGRAFSVGLRLDDMETAAVPEAK